jgi:trehalose-phosphatase
VNQPLEEVATTEGAVLSGSSPEGNVATTINAPFPFSTRFHHTDTYSSMENVMDWLRESLETAGIYLPPGTQLGAGLRIMLDYDGTLAPAGMPHSTTAPNPGVIRALKLLVATGADVWLVSGKDIKGLKSLIDIPGISYSGLFGLESNTGGETKYHPEVTEGDQIAVQEVYEILNHMFTAEKFPGIEVEHQGSLMEEEFDGSNNHQKMLVTTLVWKACDESFDPQRAIDSVTAIALEHNLQVNVGHGYINVVPLFPGKGDVVRQVCEHDYEISNPKTVVFIGDERHDRMAFEALDELAATGQIAAAVNLGVTQPIYDKVEKTVHRWGQGEKSVVIVPATKEGGEPTLKTVRNGDQRRVFIPTGAHNIDDSLVLSSDVAEHHHMLLGGPSDVAHFLTRAAREASRQVGLDRVPAVAIREPIALGY